METEGMKEDEHHKGKSIGLTADWIERREQGE